MMARIGKRILLAVVTLVCVYTVTFLMIIMTPGNPLQRGDRNLSPEVLQALEQRYNIDQPWKYYFQYPWRIIRYGDFGPVFQYRDWNCNQIIRQALPVSLTIGVLAIFVAVAIGIPLGVIGAVHRGAAWDVAGGAAALLGISVPSFIIGSALLTLFAVYLRIAPIGGWGTPGHLVLPVLTLSLPFIAYITRLTRVGMIDVLASDYIRAAVAKGVPARTVIWKHALAPAILPVVSYLGPASSQAMTGSFVVEKVFGVPGLGQHFVDAALNLDRGLLLAIVLIYSALLIGMNVIVDVAYSFIDPRIRASV